MGGEVDNRLDAAQLMANLCFISDIADHEFEAFGQKVVPGGKIVVNDDFMAMAAQHARRVTADVSCAADDQNFHGILGCEGR